MQLFCSTPNCWLKTCLLALMSLILAGCAGGSAPDNTRTQTSPSSAHVDRPSETATNPSSSTDPDPNGTLEVNLEWSIPLSRTDGEALPLNELAGYEIRYQRHTSTNIHVIYVDSPLQTTLSVASLSNGTYHFSIAAIDSDGRFSEFSPTESITLD